MLTVEIRNAEKADLREVEIFCDAEGLDVLLKQLFFLKEGSHVHLMSPAWAGNELNEEACGDQTSIIHHMKITRLPSNVTK